MPKPNHMPSRRRDSSVDRLDRALRSLWKDPQDQHLIASVLRALDGKYDLSKKIANEPAVAQVVTQMVGRIAKAFESPRKLQGKRILDIACGSNTSRAPASVSIDTPFGTQQFRNSNPDSYTAQFEPWLCRLLLELGADPIGIDLGDLDGEQFEHHRVDLKQIGALDFLPSRSFDAVQDSRLFGSPEFTAQFPNPSDRLRIAKEIVQQEKRLLKRGGTIIHSDAQGMLK